MDVCKWGVALSPQTPCSGQLTRWSTGLFGWWRNSTLTRWKSAVFTSQEETSAASAKRSSFRKCLMGRYCGVTWSSYANVSQMVWLSYSLTVCLELNRDNAKYKFDLNCAGKLICPLFIFQMCWQVRISLEETPQSQLINVSVPVKNLLKCMSFIFEIVLLDSLTYDLDCGPDVNWIGNENSIKLQKMY